MPGVNKPLLAKDNVSYCVPAMSQETLLLQELLYWLLWIVGQHRIDGPQVHPSRDVLLHSFLQLPD